MARRLDAFQCMSPVKAEVDAAKALEPVKATEARMGNAKGAIQL